MIRNIKHKGLQRLYEDGDARGIGGNLRDRVQEILTILDAARSAQDADIPGYRLHPLSGNLRGFWSVKVSGNWRVIFRFEDGDAIDVDLVDYH
jgi:proteic killer suppression protein